MTSTLRRATLLALCAAAVSCDSPTDPERPGAPARLDVVSGDLQTVEVGTELPQPLVIRVVDARGKPIEGQIVNFRVVAGGGSVFAGAALTNADGLAQERWTVGTVARDTQRVEVRAVDPANGQAIVFGTFRAVATAGAPAGISPVGSAARTGSAGSALGEPLQARVTDRFGNPVPAAAVAWTVRGGGGSVTPGTSTADSLGIASATWTLGPRLDSAQVVEAAATVAVKTAFTATAALPLGSGVVKVSGDGQTETGGTKLSQPLKVRVLLPGGQPAVGATVNWSVGAGSGTITPLVGPTDADGEATAQWTLGASAGPQSASASVAGAGTASFTATATALPPVPTSAGAVGGDTVVAGVAGSVVEDSLGVLVRDQYGNPAPGAQVAWAVTSGGGSITAITTTDAAGIARAQWVLGTGAAQTARATVAGATVRFTAHVATALAKTTGDGVTAAGGYQVTVTVLATGGSGPVAGLPIHWQVASGGGSVAPAAGATSSGGPAYGTASATWTLGAAAGTQTLTASSGGLSVTFTATVPGGGSRTLLGQVPGGVLDATPDRVAWIDPATRVIRVRTLSSGADAVVKTDTAKSAAYQWSVRAHLYTGGVLVWNTFRELFDWRGGSAAFLGTSTAEPAVDGDWAVYDLANNGLPGTGLLRRDLPAGASMQVGGGSERYDVGPDGTVVFPGAGQEVVTYRNGATTSAPSLAGNPSTGSGEYGSFLALFTDGVNAGYTTYTAAANGLYAFLSRPGGDEHLLSNTLSHGGWIYLMLSGGWTAYATQSTVYRRAPGGAKAQVNPAGSTATLMALSPGGTVVYAMNGHYWRASADGTTVGVGPAAQGERVVWRGDRFLLLSGGSVYGLGS